MALAMALFPLSGGVSSSFGVCNNCPRLLRTERIDRIHVCCAQRRNDTGNDGNEPELAVYGVGEAEGLAHHGCPIRAKELADMQRTSAADCSSPSSIFRGMLSPGRISHSSNHTFRPSFRRRLARWRALALSFQLWLRNASKANLSGAIASPPQFEELDQRVLKRF
jgi:hypothetical protein